jgi:hypothetical protein
MIAGFGPDAIVGIWVIWCFERDGSRGGGGRFCLQVAEFQIAVAGFGFGPGHSK